MTPQVDITEATKALGITEPVRVEPADLNNGDLDAAWDRGGVVNAATNPHWNGVVKVDWDAVKWNRKLSATDPRYADPNGDVTDPAVVIAHELVHIHQFEQFDNPHKADVEYMVEQMLHGYRQNRFEAEAFDRARDLARLVKVTGFED